jgi:alkylhydroperoxidase/carboxymuconolactone decarboxylase family protein YurZ
MPENPLKVFESLDPKILEHMESLRKFAYSEGAVPVKYKLLIAMALDAADGATEGVKNLAESALKAGATKEEIAEVLRVVFLLSGVGSIYTAAQALK